MDIQGQKPSTTAIGGKWNVHLDYLTTKDPFTMTVTGDNTVAINDLLVGEDWVFDGAAVQDDPAHLRERVRLSRRQPKVPVILIFRLRAMARPEDSSMGNEYCGKRVEPRRNFP